MRWDSPDAAARTYLELRLELAAPRSSSSLEVTHRRADRCSRCQRADAVNAKRRGLICARCGREWSVEELVVGNPSARRRGRRGGALSRERQGDRLAELGTLAVMLGRLGEVERFVYLADVAGLGGLRRIGELAAVRFPRHAAGLSPRELRSMIERARGRFANKLRRAGRIRGGGPE